MHSRRQQKTEYWGNQHNQQNKDSLCQRGKERLQAYWRCHDGDWNLWNGEDGEYKRRRLGPEILCQEWQLMEHPEDVGGARLHAACGRELLPQRSRKYKASGWRCQEHLGLCKGYSNLRQGLDLYRHDKMVEFFRLVMARRERLGLRRSGAQSSSFR